MLFRLKLQKLPPAPKSSADLVAHSLVKGAVSLLPIDDVRRLVARSSLPTDVDGVRVVVLIAVVQLVAHLLPLLLLPLGDVQVVELLLLLLLRFLAADEDEGIGIGIDTDAGANFFVPTASTAAAATEVVVDVDVFRPRAPHDRSSSSFSTSDKGGNASS